MHLAISARDGAAELSFLRLQGSFLNFNLVVLTGLLWDVLLLPRTVQELAARSRQLTSLMSWIRWSATAFISFGRDSSAFPGPWNCHRPIRRVLMTRTACFLNSFVLLNPSGVPIAGAPDPRIDLNHPILLRLHPWKRPPGPLMVQVAWVFLRLIQG